MSSSRSVSLRAVDKEAATSAEGISIPSKDAWSLNSFRKGVISMLKASLANKSRPRNSPKRISSSVPISAPPSRMSPATPRFESPPSPK